MPLQTLLLAIALAVTVLTLAAYLYSLRTRLKGLDAQRQAFQREGPGEGNR